MEKFKVSFEANNQQLKALGTKHASDTYADIEATFVLGEKWTDMDSVSAVWWNDFTRVATVLDSQGKCVVPHEVLTRKGCVRVNLVGSIVEGDELITRLTSYSAEAVQVNEKIKLTGNEPQSITPSQYEQFVQNVKADADRAEAGATESEQSAQNASESASASAVSASDSARSATVSAGYAQDASEIAVEVEVMKNEVELAKDKVLGMRATAETLEAGSDATASYSDGLLTLGIPRGDQGIQGIQGETGATPNFSIGDVDTLEPNEPATATITGTAENPVLNLGIPKGEQGDVNLSQLEALLPTENASGEIVTITDGQAVVPAKSLKVTLEPIQSGSGTPSPDNVRPISGHTEVVTEVCGVNVWDEEWEVGEISSSTGENYPHNSIWRTVGYISVLPSTAYYVASGVPSKPIRARFYDKDKNYIGYVPSSGSAATSSTFVTPTNAYYLRFAPNNADIPNHDISINYPSTDHDYHAHDGHTYTTTLGRTVYGGTLDVVSGELVVDRAMVDLGSLTWAYSGGFFRITNLTNFKKPSSNSAVVNAISSAYSAMSWNAIQRTSNGAFAVSAGSDNPIFCNTEYSDATAFKTAMDGVQLCYELATPQTIQLTPQEVKLLHGTNNVWSDGVVTLVYSADIQKWVEKKLQS